MKDKATFQNKVKVLNKLFDSGCDTEKKLQQLDMEAILKIPNITIPDMGVIMELQKNTKSGKLFSYLGGGSDEATKMRGKAVSYTHLDVYKRQILRFFSGSATPASLSRNRSTAST